MHEQSFKSLGVHLGEAEIGAGKARPFLGCTGLDVVQVGNGEASRSIRMVNDLERIGDFAKNIAKRGRGFDERLSYRRGDAAVRANGAAGHWSFDVGVA